MRIAHGFEGYFSIIGSSDGSDYLDLYACAESERATGFHELRAHMYGEEAEMHLRAHVS